MGQDAGKGAHTVGFMLVERFSMIGLSASIEPLRLANRVAGRKVFDWRFYSANGEPAEASNGMRVMVEGAFSEIGPLPDVIVCGGEDIHRATSRELLARLRRLSLYGSALGAVSTGAYALAKAGLLDGYRCAMHREAREALQEEFPAVEVTDAAFEIDRNRFTCAEGTAAFDMMLARVAAKAGASVAALVADHPDHRGPRETGEWQGVPLRARLGSVNPRLLQVVETMERHVETPLPSADLARAARLSARQLERLFRRHFNETPTRYYLRLRLNKARHLLLQTSMPILPVGLACGFVSASHFSKTYADFFSRTPSEERSGSKARRRLKPRPAAMEALS